MDPFRNRREAGRTLARELRAYAHRSDVRVLALPRGGVPVAYEVSRALEAPLDVFVVRKLGVPGIEELAMGAVASGGVRVLNDSVIGSLGIPQRVVDRVAGEQTRELDRQERIFRGDRPALDVRDKTAIVVDDGLATGASMKAAIQALRSQHPARIVAAAPTAAREACERIAALADEVVCARMPEPFESVGRSYQDFTQTTDEEVRSLL
jgi:predicted phosphoribosyltransferase